MASFNRVILMGNLTRDPELRYLPSGMGVCEFTLAVNHRWRDKDGNQKDDVCFIDVTAWGRQAETINQYMAKGRSILVEGRLKYETWSTPEGAKRSKHSVVLENFQFVGSREGGGAPVDRSAGGEPGRAAGPHQGRSTQPQEPGRSYETAPPAPTYEDRPPTSEEIPF